MKKISEISRKFKNRTSKTRGLSLIEILIAMAIVAVILIALLSLYTTGQKYFINESTRADTLQDSQYPLAWITRDVKEALQVLSSWGSYTTSSNCLVLEIPSVDSSGVIIDISADFDYIIYRLNSNKLERIIDALDGVSSRTDDTRVLAENTNSLVFAFFDSQGAELTSGFDAASSINIALSSSRQGVGRTFQETLNAGVKLRNKAS